MEEEQSKLREKYDEVCAYVEQELAKANKPVQCNMVMPTLVNKPYIFSELDYLYQWSTDWEIWRYKDIIYLYREEVEDYPVGYWNGNAPMIVSFRVTDIQYFKMEGDVFSETKIHGGQVKQNRSTGRITQTPLQTKTVERDTRYVRITLKENGIIKHLDFTKTAYDVLYALIPEKEYQRVIASQIN